METPKVSQTLLMLAEALEQLALIIAAEKGENSQEYVRQLEVIQKKVKKIQEKPKHNLKLQVKQKHKKGYIKNWLVKKNMYVGKAIDTLQVDNRLYKVADFLADHYRHLEDFYSQLKRHQVIKKDFIYKTPGKSIKYIQQWGKMLFENKIVDAFQFLDQNKIDVDIAEIHSATYFINGYWLEIFLRKELAMLMRENIHKIHSFDILAQAEIVKPDKTNTEVDLFLMINEKIYWFECKSGDIGRYYKRFKKQRLLFDLPESQSFIVVSAMKMHRDKAAEENSGMTMLHAENLSAELKREIFDKL